jgi:hypothetical protein
MLQRMVEPHHEYEYRLTSTRIELIKIVPATVGHGDPVVDAGRFGRDATEAAKKYRDQLFSKDQSA